MENRKVITKNILERVITKGGLIGSCAQLYINDNEKGYQFVIELGKMSVYENFQQFFGEELVTDINSYILNSG